MDFQQSEPKNKIIPHKIAVKPLKIGGTDKFTPNNILFLTIVDYQGKLKK